MNKRIFKKKHKDRKHPLEALADIYKQQVEEVDANGYPDLWKQCATAFFDDLRNGFVRGDSVTVFNPTEIEYLDGYFIFGSGTNSIVHFNVAECPGWKFGIWWNAPEQQPDEKIVVKGEWFAQFEETIDKFKPTRSEITAEIKITLANSGDKLSPLPFSSYRVKRQLSFISNEPYLAFCRDYCFWDYNAEYHSREEAKEEYDNWRAYEDKRQKYIKLLDNKMLEMANRFMAPLFTGGCIADQGECVSPRYELRAPLKKNRRYASKRGCYSIVGESEAFQRAKEEYEKTYEECKAIAEEQDVFWFRTLYFNVLLF